VLLAQFHDVLPGTSIAWVHRQAEREYARVATELEGVVAAALRTLVGDGGRELRANAGPFPVAGAPALGIGQPGAPARPATVEETAEGVVLANPVLRVVVDRRGLLTSIRDVTVTDQGRELVAPGAPANLLQLFRDTPTSWDAWDVDVRDRRVGRDLVDVTALTVEAGSDGPAVRIVRSTGPSTITQVVSLRPGEPVVDVVTEVDWHDRQKLLKLAFPLDVHADRATSEIQFGHVHRPTHVNTSWDAARFETCAHRWVHVGEPGYGVAVANDATYGHDVARTSRPGGGTTTTVRLSLLRAPLFPDPDADQGTHRFAVALRAGATIGDAVAEGYRLNVPPRRVRGEREVAPLVAVGDPAVVVEAVKLADDRSGDVVVRLYESRGTRVAAAVTADFAHGAVVETDLLERPLPEPVALTPDGTLDLRPFKIVTLRFRR
jgi:alpha-mannosidase